MTRFPIHIDTGKEGPISGIGNILILITYILCLLSLMQRNRLVLNTQILLALKFDPYDLDLMITLCETLLEAGKYEKALEYSDAILEKVIVFPSFFSNPK